MFNILLYKLKKYLYNNDNKMKFNLSSRNGVIMKKTQYVAGIFDGHTYIERRIYEDENGFGNVKINGMFFKLKELKHYDITTYFTGNKPIR